MKKFLKLYLLALLLLLPVFITNWYYLSNNEILELTENWERFKNLWYNEYTKWNYYSAVSYFQSAANNINQVYLYSYDSYIQGKAKELLATIYGLIGVSYCQNWDIDDWLEYYERSMELNYTSTALEWYSLCKEQKNAKYSCDIYWENVYLWTDNKCYCKTWYDWNSSMTSCIESTKESADRSCQITYGPNSEARYLDYNKCTCKSGYNWNSSMTSCVKSTKVEADNLCKEKYGDHSVAVPTDYTTCICENGYKWNDINLKTSCVKYYPESGNNNTLNNDSIDFNRAYEFAYANWITTMESIDKADMNWTLTRIAMAKMISNYAINVLWYTYDYSLPCDFKDVNSSLNAQYDNWVIKSCELWLMGQNIAYFRPFDTVTRAEFATVLSRLLNRWTDDLKYLNAWNPYYKEHLNYLESKWIIDNSIKLSRNANEIRGYVMWMLLKSNDAN